MSDSTQIRRKAIIGNPKGSFWRYDNIDGFDLTHPPSTTSPIVPNAVTIKTTTLPVTIDPAKSALVIVDMQNFFLSPALGKSPDSLGLRAQKQLLDYAIPAARRAGIQILWLNWGLTQQDIDEMPPSELKAFGFQTFEAQDFHSLDSPTDAEGELEASGKSTRRFRGLGQDLGEVTLSDGTRVAAGRMLMRDQWNTQLTPEFTRCFREGLQMEQRPDQWLHKNRMSGLWSDSAEIFKVIQRDGIQTLIFAGVNTDQCVGGSMTDAYSKGFDCILLRDGCATTSPAGSQECFEFNAAHSYGFCTSCQDLWDGASTSTSI